MFALSMEGQGVRPGTHQQQARKQVTQSTQRLLTPSLLSDIDRGKVSLNDVNAIRRAQGRASTPADTKSRTDKSITALRGGGTPNNTTSNRSLPSPILGVDSSLVSSSTALRARSEVDEPAHITFSDMCETAPNAINPRWLETKREAEETRKEHAKFDQTRRRVKETVAKSLGVEEAIEVARMVTRQEELQRTMDSRNTVSHQVARFAELELKAREGNVTRAERKDLFSIPTEASQQDTLIEKVIERFQLRESADRPYRHLEPQHMRRLAAKEILKEEDLKSFGDELTLLQSKSDTTKIMHGRNTDGRSALFSQLSHWAKMVMARGDLSDYLEEFLINTKKSNDGCIYLSSVHEMMLSNGLRLSREELAEFDAAVDPMSRGRVVPERLRQVWKLNEAVHRVRPLNYFEAEQAFDECMEEHQGPVTAMFLSKWLGRTGASVDPDVCHTILLRLPRPLTKSVLFSEEVFAFIQDVWQESRASEKEILSESGMTERAKQLESMAAETNDTLDCVDRVNRVIHQSTERLMDVSEHFHKQLEITAKLASLIPTKYTHTISTMTDVSIVGEMQLLWDAFIVQRELELVDDTDDDLFTQILQRQNAMKTEELVRLRTEHQSIVSRLKHRMAFLEQKLRNADCEVTDLKEKLEHALVGIGGFMDFSDQDKEMQKASTSHNELLKQMNDKLQSLQSEHQARMRDAVKETMLARSRAEEAERTLVAERESLRHSERVMDQKVLELENEVRSREEVINNSAQFVREYELKYQLQEEKFKELEKALQASKQEIQRLHESLELTNKSHAHVVPREEMEKQLTELRATLTRQLETEVATKNQFASQLQSAKGDLQRIEFNWMDRYGVLEGKIAHLEGERDSATLEQASAVNQLLQSIVFWIGRFTRVRTDVANCKRIEDFHKGVVQTLNSALQDGLEYLDKVRLHKCIIGSPCEDEVNDIQRALHAELERVFPPPESKLMEQLSSTKAELDKSTHNLDRVTRDLQVLTATSSTQEGIITRAMGQLKEFVSSLCRATSPEDLAAVTVDEYLSLDGITSAAGNAISDMAGFVKSQIGGMVTSSDAAANDKRRGSNLGAAGSSRRTSTVGRSASGEVTLPASDVMAMIDEALLVTRSSISTLTIDIAVPSMKRSEGLQWLTRDDVAALTVAKRTLASSRTAWCTHLLRKVTKSIKFSSRRLAMERAGSDAGVAAVAEIHARWFVGWATQSFELLGDLSRATSTAALTSLSLMEKDEARVVTPPVDDGHHRTPRSQGPTPHGSFKERAASSVAKQKPAHGTKGEEKSLGQPIATSAGAKRTSAASGAPNKAISRAGSTVSGVNATPNLSPSDDGVFTPPGEAINHSNSVTPTDPFLSSNQQPPSTPIAIGSGGGARKKSSLAGVATIVGKIASKRSLRSSATFLLDDEEDKSLLLQEDDNGSEKDEDDDDAMNESKRFFEEQRRLLAAELETHCGNRRESYLNRSQEPVRRVGSLAASKMLMNSWRSALSHSDNAVAVDDVAGVATVDSGPPSPKPQEAATGQPFMRKPSLACAVELTAENEEAPPLAAMLPVENAPLVFDVAVDAFVEHDDAWCMTDPVTIVEGSIRRKSSALASLVHANSSALLKKKPQEAPQREGGLRHPTTSIPERTTCSTQTTLSGECSATKTTATSATSVSKGSVMQHRGSVHSAQRHAETQTPPPPSGTPTLPNEYSHLSTPTTSESHFPNPSTQHRVDSAKRLALPRPSSSEHRPHSAIRLDDESAEALRSSSHNKSLGDPKASKAVPPREESWLTITDFQLEVSRVRKQGLHFSEVEFPPPTDQTGIQSVSALEYLFDSLPLHCRIPAAKYCMLAMFTPMEPEIFIEYLYTQHFLPNRSIFIVPSDEEMKQCFHSLRHYGALLTRLKKPAPTIGGDLSLTSANGQHPSSRVKQIRSLQQIPFDVAPQRAPSPPRVVAPTSFSDAFGAHSVLTSQRPFSANSFPNAVVVLPPDSAALDLGPHPHGNELNPSVAGPSSGTAMKTTRSMMESVMSMMNPSDGPSTMTNDTINQSSVAPTSDEAGAVQATSPILPTEDVKPTSSCFAPVVELPVLRRVVPSRQGDAALHGVTGVRIASSGGLPMDKSVTKDDILTVYSKLEAQHEVLMSTAAVPTLGVEVSTSSSAPLPPPVPAPLLGQPALRPGASQPLQRPPTPLVTEYSAKDALAAATPASVETTEAGRNRLTSSLRRPTSHKLSAEAKESSTSLRPLSRQRQPSASEIVQAMVSQHKQDIKLRMLKNGPPMLSVSISKLVGPSERNGPKVKSGATEGDDPLLKQPPVIHNSLAIVGNSSPGRGGGIGTVPSLDDFMKGHDVALPLIPHQQRSSSFAEVISTGEFHMPAAPLDTFLSYSRPQSQQTAARPPLSDYHHVTAGGGGGGAGNTSPLSGSLVDSTLPGGRPSSSAAVREFPTVNLQPSSGVYTVNLPLQTLRSCSPTPPPPLGTSSSSAGASPIAY